jgi:ribosomal protein L44E
MPNRNLSQQELADIFAPLLIDVRSRLTALAGGDVQLHWALRRKLAKELTYDERSKPMQRRALKARKRVAQSEKCTECNSVLPESGAVLDRLQAMEGYTFENTRLLCPACDTRIQKVRGYA